MSPIQRIQKALDLRQGEGRLFVVMGAFLLANTANTTVLSAAKNGLFLSVYEPELIPHSIIYASLLTAVVALLFTGVVAETQRRSLAMGLTAVLALSILACRLLVDVNPEWTFVVYLWLSVVQVLVLTHAWDFASSMLTGSNTYQGNPMEPHLKLNRLSPLNHEHFALWLRLFNLSVDSLFEGEIAEQALIDNHFVKKTQTGQNHQDKNAHCNQL